MKTRKYGLFHVHLQGLTGTLGYVHALVETCEAHLCAGGEGADFSDEVAVQVKETNACAGTLGHKHIALTDQ